MLARELIDQLAQGGIARHTVCPLRLQLRARRQLDRSAGVPVGCCCHDAIMSGFNGAMSTPNNTAADRSYQVEKTDEEWKAALDPTRYAVLREAATERAWSGELLDESRAGLYTCAGCNAELFTSGTKFDSGCGWPSFYESVNPDAVQLIEDSTLGMVRTEVRCAKCGSHLGHVFDDGFGTPTGLRYCMNSLSLGFQGGE